MTEPGPSFPGWEHCRARLIEAEPRLYELEPGGALGLALRDEDWMLELTPDGRLICQAGMTLEDIQRIVSEGTPEDLGTDEIAKQAKYYLQPMAQKYRKVFLGAGFEEVTEMNEYFVAVTFQRPVNLADFGAVMELVAWCQSRFRGKG